MGVLAWWLIPFGVTLIALAWALWRSRPRKPIDVNEAMALREQMRAALERPMPTEDRAQHGTVQDPTS